MFRFSAIKTTFTVLGLAALAACAQPIQLSPEDDVRMETFETPAEELASAKRQLRISHGGYTGDPETDADALDFDFRNKIFRMGGDNVAKLTKHFETATGVRSDFGQRR